jgi:hypothetical protein
VSSRASELKNLPLKEEKFNRGRDSYNSALYLMAWSATGSLNVSTSWRVAIFIALNLIIIEPLLDRVVRYFDIRLSSPFREEYEYFQENPVWLDKLEKWLHKLLEKIYGYRRRL